MNCAKEIATEIYLVCLTNNIATQPTLIRNDM